MAGTSTLTDEIQTLEPKLAQVIDAIAHAVVQVSVSSWPFYLVENASIGTSAPNSYLKAAGTTKGQEHKDDVLRVSDAREAGSSNVHGDQQLEVDKEADLLIFAKLRNCGAVETASSEETSEMVDLGGKGFSVAFDPVDGSSIIPANFAVGSIFGVWPGKQLLGRRGREQVAACYAVYGPRTAFILSRPQIESTSAHVVQEFVLSQDEGSARWLLQRSNIRIGEKPVFAPANLRASAGNSAYADLIQHWMKSKYTLRYTGGLVPDIHHILTKGGGIFCNPQSQEAPAKLRLLYEGAPMAFIVESAGGSSHDGDNSVLDREITAAHNKTILSLGSSEEVKRSVKALQSGH